MVMLGFLMAIFIEREMLMAEFNLQMQQNSD